jgi:hypothetical protein
MYFAERIGRYATGARLFVSEVRRACMGQVYATNVST